MMSARMQHSTPEIRSSCLFASRLRPRIRKPAPPAPRRGPSRFRTFPNLSAVRGFQLLDLMLTCLVIAVLAGLSAPFLQGLTEAQKSGAACDLLVSTVSKARALAIAENLPVQLVAEPSGRFGLQVRGRDSPVIWRRLPEGVRFRRLPRNPVTFHSRGTAAPSGSYELEGPAGGMRVVVAVSGRIRWSRD